MVIEPSTLNVLLGAVIALQGWMVRELFRIRSKLDVIAEHCPVCQKPQKN